MFPANDAIFAEAVNSGLPMVAIVSADWCGPCRTVKPLLEKLEIELKGSLNFYSVDSDSLPELCAHLKISAIPTLIFVRGSSEVSRLVGLASEAKIRKHIEELLS